MIERKPFQFKEIKQKEYEPVHLPPAWCGAICRNAMSEMCIENCAIKRDCSYFEPKPVPFDELRPPRPEELKTSHEKFTAVYFYLSKIISHLQGERDEYPIIRRNPNHTRSSQVPKDLKIQSVLHGISEAITSPETGEEHQSQEVRSSEVAGTSD